MKTVSQKFALFSHKSEFTIVFDDKNLCMSSTLYLSLGGENSKELCIFRLYLFLSPLKRKKKLVIIINWCFALAKFPILTFINILCE